MADHFISQQVTPSARDPFERGVRKPLLVFFRKGSLSYESQELQTALGQFLFWDGQFILGEVQIHSQRLAGVDRLRSGDRQALCHERNVSRRKRRQGPLLENQALVVQLEHPAEEIAEMIQMK